MTRPPDIVHVRACDLSRYKLTNGEHWPAMDASDAALDPNPTLTDYLRAAIADQFGHDNLSFTLLVAVPHETNRSIG